MNKKQTTTTNKLTTVVKGAKKESPMMPCQPLYAVR
jgi:hypothetical protein